MPFLENLVEGVADAAGATGTVNRIEQNKADRRATSEEELHAKTKMIMDNAKGVQDNIAALGPNPDPAKLAPYQSQLHQLMQEFHDLYHPVKNPGHLPLLGRVLQSIRGQQPQEAVTVDQMVQGSIAGAGAGEFPGVSPEDQTKARRIKYGLDPRATQPGENWVPFDGTFADGTKATLLRNSKDGSITDLAGNAVPPEKLATFKAQPKGSIKEAIVPDAQSETGFSKEGYDAQGNVIYHVQNVVPPRGALGRKTTTTDPFGVSSTSVSTPVYPGGKTGTAGKPEGLITPGNINLDNRPVLHNQDGTHSTERSFSIGTDKGEVLIPRIFDGKDHTEQEAIEHYRQTGQHMGIFDTPEHADAYADKVHNRGSKKPGEMKKELQSKVAKGTDSPKLDASGHIPADAPVNPGLRAAANNLLDGMDVDKLPIPQKDRAAAQELAEKYGWKGQGLFTPKDQLLLRESETYLNQAMNDPSLKVLNSATSRLKLMNALNDKPGLSSDILASTWKLSDAEANFLSMYRQLVGTISGLGQLTRANRTTEAAIKRLMSELPNPREVQSADQAKTRIKRLQSELTVARQKGYISTSDEGGEGNTEPKVRKFNPATGTLE